MPEMPEDSATSTQGMYDYNKNSSAQQTMVHLQAGRIADLVADLGEIKPALKIVDYGSGPGRSTVDTVKPAIAAYRARFPDAPVVVCHADLPGNDWNALFDLATGPTGYGDAGAGVRIQAAVGSFYDQLMESGTVSLATCFAASHWFSHAVHPHAPETLWYADLQGDARAQVQAYAQADWTRFLTKRAAELHQGGYVLVATLGSVPDAGEINGIAGSGRGIYRAMHRVAKSMQADGLIGARHLDSFLFSLWFLTAEEAALPLKTDPGLAEAFDIRHISVEPAPVNPGDIFAEFLDDPAEYARKYTGYTRAFADTALRDQLFDPAAQDNPDQTADSLTETFFDRLEQLYRQETDKYACEIWHLVVVLRRK